MGPLVELPLLESSDPGRPFNHSAGTTIAARGGHVVVAYINIHFEGSNTFQITEPHHLGVAVAVSHDSGETFGGAVNPGAEDLQSSLPVVRAAADSTFWLVAWGELAGTLSKSQDHGETWETVAADDFFLTFAWIAIDDPGQAIYMAGRGGYSLYAFDGTRLAFHAYPWNSPSVIGGYVDGQGAHFVQRPGDDFDLLGYFRVVLWDGEFAPVQQGELLEGGFLDNEMNFCLGIGQTVGGGQWIVRALRSGQAALVVLRVRNLPDDEGTDIQLNEPGSIAFYPAGALDGEGRLHVIWYENSEGGVLKYTRSLSNELTEGFTEAVIVDPDAYPGGDWYPFFNSEQGGRRLREYIGISVDGNRAHLAWTHAPGPPSRVYTTYVEFD